MSTEKPPEGSAKKPSRSKHEAAAVPVDEAQKSPSFLVGFFKGFFKIRDEPTALGRLFMGALCIAGIVALWWLATRGPVETRLVGPNTIGSPREVFGTFPSLWFERALTRNTIASLVRVLEGFGLAVLIGVPLGILCGTFKRIAAFFAPVTIFGRNVPVVALVPLTMLWASTDEGQKILFLFIASVAFVVSDAAQIVSDVPEAYLDTAKTLGASRSQIIFKVLVPLALPDLFNSVRLLFGLAFGYIILVEMFNLGQGGLGALIFISQRRAPRDHVYLLLLVITLVAYILDRLLYFIGKMLFPYRFRDE
jgi:ABC-type nitrate/sulfonate/bicarbonate transport system permease component